MDRAASRAGARGRGRHGVTFTEIMIATAIMAAAFIPIAGMIRSWFAQEKQEKMEAKMASFISVKMNEYLVEKPWDEVEPCDWTPIPPAEMDNIEVEYKVAVEDIVTDASTFEFPDVVYHEPCSGGNEAGATLTDVNRPVNELDRDTTGGGTSFLKEIELTVRWRWPGTNSDWSDRRQMATFLTRRANLK